LSTWPFGLIGKKDSAEALQLSCSTDRQPTFTRTFCPDRSFPFRVINPASRPPTILATLVATLIVSPPHVSKILDCERKNKERCYAPDECDTTPRSRAAVFTQRVNIRVVQPLQRFMRIHGERRDLRYQKYKNERGSSNERNKANPTH
jgi:hypothetical protein